MPLMSNATTSGVKSDARAPSANDRFRAGARGRLGWSGTLAVAAHAALMLLSFGWQLAYQPLDDDAMEASRLLALPGFGDVAAPGSGLSAPAPPSGELDATETDPGTIDGPAVSEASFAEVWDALGDRLRGRGAPVPSLAEPEDVVDEQEAALALEGSADSERGAPTIDGNASTIDLAELPEPDSLSLDRLSALRPELAFMTASAWVLIRNQPEVEAFLRRSSLSGRIDPAASGSVSVTLWIDRRGSVEWAEISQSSGRNDLDEFTLALFNEVAAFRAAREQGVYVSRSVTFSVNYPW